MQSIVDQNMQDLRALLKELDTDPNMMEDFGEGFYTWSSNKPTPQMIMAAGQLQSFILWDNFSHRFLADAWKTQQQEYYKNKQLCKLGEKWAREVLRWILKNARQ